MKKALYILSLLLMLSLTAGGQNIGQGSPPPRDNEGAGRGEEEIRLTGDTKSVVMLDSVWHPDPKKATMLSAALPGAGQIYNGHWWKVPILYAGIGTLGYFIYWNNTQYVNYRNAYIDFTDDDPNTTRYTEIFPTDDYVIEDDDWFEATVENGKDNYRRDRDYLIIGMVGLYALNIIEANVAAHLHDFDVSDDLTLKVGPDLDYDFMTNRPTVGISLKFNINK